MEDEDTGSRLPLAIYLKDSNVSVNIHQMMLSEWTTRNDMSVYCAYESSLQNTLWKLYFFKKQKKRK